MKWGIKSMVWYVLILVFAFLVSLYYYNQVISNSDIQRIFFR